MCLRFNVNSLRLLWVLSVSAVCFLLRVNKPQRRRERKGGAETDSSNYDLTTKRCTNSLSLTLGRDEVNLLSPNQKAMIRNRALCRRREASAYGVSRRMRCGPVRSLETVPGKDRSPG